MILRFGLALALVGLVSTLVVPPASARMHFTGTRERLEALQQRITSSMALTNPTEVQVQARELVNLAGAVKTAAEEASARPVSGAEDKAVLSTVVQNMDKVSTSAGQAASSTTADQQKTALQEVKQLTDSSLSTVQARIQAQLAAPPPAPAAQAQPSPQTQAQPAPASTLPRAGDEPAAQPFGALLAISLLLLAGGFGFMLRSRRASS